MSTLHLYFETPELYQHYNTNCHSHSTDSGFDLFCPEQIIVKAKQQAKINFQIRCKLTILSSLTTSGYWLVPRSSIVKTPLRMSNSIGLIDADYRGLICAFVDNISDQDYIIEKHQRLFQLVSPTLNPMTKVYHDTPYSDKDESFNTRKEGGFGSTGV